MTYSTYLPVTLATLLLASPSAETDLPADASPSLEEALAPTRQRLCELVEAYRRAPISPHSTAQFEKNLQQLVREQARLCLEWTYNHLEPEQPQRLPSHVRFEGSSYRRLYRKTPQTLSTLFGNITLRRLGYRAAPDQGEPVLFPLCRSLGVMHGTTPALLERVAHGLAEDGATQGRVLQRLRHEHGVKMGVKRLRQLTEFISAVMEEQRPEAQIEQLLKWLEQAHHSRGRHRPVLSVGRDGITMGVRIKIGSVHEVASVATISVYDRRGQRVCTVYLAHTPESGQGTLSQQIEQVFLGVLKRWQGPQPRYAYVTDAGDNETTYYRKVLRRLKHPQTSKRLKWTWVVDYYHASERLWTMAEALFGVGQKWWSWARKMQKLLLKPGGIGRVLHSAAAMRSRVQLRGKRLKNFQRAYRYLQQRRKHLRYAEYRRLGIPLGSGVTEAACKTVFTQRLKLSGMRWHKAGALRILRLRVILLSGVWFEVFGRTLKAYSKVQVETPDGNRDSGAEKAA